jgi:hypothetical protein
LRVNGSPLVQRGTARSANMKSKGRKLVERKYFAHEVDDHRINIYFEDMEYANKNNHPLQMHRPAEKC